MVIYDILRINDTNFLINEVNLGIFDFEFNEIEKKAFSSQYFNTFLFKKLPQTSNKENYI